MLVAGALLSTIAIAQPAPPNGPRKVDPRWHAFVNATVVTSPGERIEDATIVVRDGVIVSVERGGRAPDGARVWDYAGLTIYPGLIDAYVPVEAPKPAEDDAGAHWNEKVTPQRSALDGEGVPAKTREAMRAMGFTAGAIAPEGGVFRGAGAVVLFDELAENDSSSEHPVVVRDQAFQTIAFERAGFRSRSYPASEMGVIALIRQTLMDADWRAQVVEAYRRSPVGQEPPPPADALDALGPNDRGAPPLLFDTSDELQTLRAAKIARETDREAILVGSGTEFRRLDAIAEDGLPIILPLTYPETPNVGTIADAETVTLRELMTWEQAPTNARRLLDAGLTVALTTEKLRKGEKFPANLRKAIDHGLAEEQALAMLTTTPARLLGVDGRIGRIAPGLLANMVVVEGGLFDKDAEIRDVWVAGRRHEINPAPQVDPSGRWAFTSGADHGVLVISMNDKGKVSIEAETEDESDQPVANFREVKLTENRLSYLVDMPDEEETVLATAVIRGDSMFGQIMVPGGDVMDWTATRRTGSVDGQTAAEDESKTKEDDADDAIADIPETLPLPFGAYGLTELPAQEDLVITNATIWTGGDAGILEDATLVVRNGQIDRITQRQVRMPGARVIDAEGRHITPGIFDPHSHTGIDGSVNEGTQAVTSEVRIADVINPSDISWYRQLAGGVTAVNQLHGSANPIGGQNSVVKLRWGAAHPDDMRIDGAIEGIKFALGENVKQSNWGSEFTTRYPQTRMGVETIIRDRFIAARDYEEEWNDYESLPSSERRRTAPPRRDLELEALLEILNGERLIHCHSYRQDEILMLCRVAGDFGFTIGTFQHVLEGYKVAEAIREHAIGASCFSDWWAYKFEVYDAIPWNGAIMHDVGVNVSFNSDSDELARRLNAEAGKAVKYGGVDPHEALKFVTYNAAKQMGVEDRVGSLEPGKDADFAIWSGDPLSPTSLCEATFIDGREHFSLEQDAELRARDQRERDRLIQKILAQGKPGGKGGEPMENQGDPHLPEQNPPAQPTDPEAAREADLLREYHLMLLRAGVDPNAHRCGVCGDHTSELHSGH